MNVGFRPAVDPAGRLPFAPGDVCDRQEALHNGRPRKSDKDDRALAQGGIDAQRPAMQFDKRIGDRKPQTRTLHSIGEGQIGLLERASEARQVGARNPRTGIFNIDVNLFVKGLRANADGAAIGSKLHRIAQQCHQNALDGLAIRWDRFGRADADLDRGVLACAAASSSRMAFLIAVSTPNSLLLRRTRPASRRDMSSTSEKTCSKYWPLSWIWEQ